MSFSNYFPLDQREAQWQAFQHQDIHPFWQEFATESVYQTQDNINLHYAFIKNPNSKKLIVLLPGRVESYLKYKELAYDLFHAGFSIFTIDHRGQGQSSRSLKDPEKGYVKKFDYFADDLNAVLESTQLLQHHEEVCCLAHSMGSAIALNWQHRYKIGLKKLVLVAPMLGINAGPLTQVGAKWVASISDKLARCIKPEAPYFIGQHGYQRHEYKDNNLCRSLHRFEHGQDILAKYPLGGVTTTWLYQALKFISTLPEVAKSLSCDTFLLQAENELIVSLNAQNEWTCLAEGKVTKKLVKEARHEILMESDRIREPLILELIEFLTSN
ncbi:alpha/beta fold hydrolase [Catenovulum maritimum]|uniref:Serine aminopeptidase S33 domain-containing protein n=1 Tax=Catenovulum maritimum TaxID=1513271 RepID=A0A0J8GP25_9ALTE|nr:alpha/beta fold hydrolase [Catenovulum maritimum]KMT64565.1 hypothetical protein XM47_14025 [Catenovulum maritimum]